MGIEPETSYIEEFLYMSIYHWDVPEGTTLSKRLSVKNVIPKMVVHPKKKKNTKNQMANDFEKLIYVNIAIKIYIYTNVNKVLDINLILV